MTNTTPFEDMLSDLAEELGFTPDPMFSDQPTVTGEFGAAVIGFINEHPELHLYRWAEDHDDPELIVSIDLLPHASRASIAAWAEGYAATARGPWKG